MVAVSHLSVSIGCNMQLLAVVMAIIYKKFNGLVILFAPYTVVGQSIENIFRGWILIFVTGVVLTLWGVK